jgi:NAD(P)H-flavin reductase
MVFPDFETGDVLYLTGSAEILIGEKAASVMPRTNLAVKITISDSIFVERGLPFVGTEGEWSPYNPAVKTLAIEGNIATKFDESGSATLVEKTELSRTVSRYRFKTPKAVEYRPGQWVAIDFSEELDMGYSHMRNEDPQSLNDDYIRTFTVSSHPSTLPKNEFEITVRLHGPVTEFLSQQRSMRHILEFPLKGFGGDFIVSTPEEGGIVPFFAGGVGITPLLGQLPDLDCTKLRLFWIIPADDADFVADIFQQFNRLAASTTLYLTGVKAPDIISKPLEAQIQRLKRSGAAVNVRRPTKVDFDSIDAEKYYLCAGNPLRKILLEWLHGKVVIFENFDY